MELDKIRNQIHKSNQMDLDTAKNIVDKMYQSKMSQIEKDDTIYVDKLNEIEFTYLESAALILLREVQFLESKLEKAITADKIQSTINDLTEYYKEHPSDDKVVTQVMSLNILSSLLPEEGDN